MKPAEKEPFVPRELPPLDPRKEKLGKALLAVGLIGFFLCVILAVFVEPVRIIAALCILPFFVALKSGKTLLRGNLTGA